MLRQRAAPKVGRRRRPHGCVAGAVIVAAVIVLGACGSAAEPGRAAKSGPKIVASTNIYGAIAHAVAGDHAEITSIIDDANADPHDYEASTRDILTVSKADIVIVNGAGYDEFMQNLLDAADQHDATVLDAVAISGKKAGEGSELNEHVWYSFEAMIRLAERLRDALVEVDPSHADDYRTNAEQLIDDLHELTDRAEQVGSEHPDATAAVTEPVPLYLLATIGIENRTPEAFSEAVEEGEEASPAVLVDTLALFTHDPVDLLVVNAQTVSDQTDQVVAAAKDHRIPVVSVTETLPKGETYVGWMRANLDAIADALDRHAGRSGS